MGRPPPHPAPQDPIRHQGGGRRAVFRPQGGQKRRPDDILRPQRPLRCASGNTRPGVLRRTPWPVVS